MTTLLWAGTAGAWLFVLVFLVDGLTRPGYESMRHPVSSLALGPRGWVQTGNFVVCGALVAVASVAVPGAWGGLLPAVAIAVLGVGLVLSGVFSMDPMRGYPPGTPEGTPEETTRAHRIHDTVGAVVFFTLPVTAVGVALTVQEPLWRWGSGAVGLVAGAGTLWFGQAWEEESRYTGLIQRLPLVVGLGWLGAFLATGALGAP